MQTLLNRRAAGLALPAATRSTTRPPCTTPRCSSRGCARRRAQLERAYYVYDERYPDLRVNNLLHVLDKQELRSTPGTGYRGWNGARLETVDVREGTLAIDLVHARRNMLLWRAVAEGRIDHKTTQQPGPAIDAVVAELFTRLPGTSVR